MVNTDPSQYPDENPLAVKDGGSSPTPDEVKQYTDGVVSPFEIAYDNSYIYRGLDENKIGDSRNPYPTHLGTSPRYHGKCGGGGGGRRPDAQLWLSTSNFACNSPRDSFKH